MDQSLPVREIPLQIIKKHGSVRKFKQAKRQDLKALKQAYSKLGAGCAYSPAYDEIREIKALLDTIEKKQSVKNWGN